MPTTDLEAVLEADDLAFLVELSEGFAFERFIVDGFYRQTTPDSIADAAHHLYLSDDETAVLAHLVHVASGGCMVILSVAQIARAVFGEPQRGQQSPSGRARKALVGLEDAGAVHKVNRRRRGGYDASAFYLCFRLHL